MGVSGQPVLPPEKTPCAHKQARAGSASTLGRRGRKCRRCRSCRLAGSLALIASFWRANEGRNVGLAGELISHCQ
jgi:hypothetical protein